MSQSPGVMTVEVRPWGSRSPCPARRLGPRPRSAPSPRKAAVEQSIVWPVLRAARTKGFVMRSATLSCVLIGAFHAPMAAQTQRIGTVEVYGARHISPDEVKRASGLSAGEPAPEDGAAIEARVRRLRGVSETQVSVVCCENGESVVYIGIQEGRPRLETRAAPTGVVALPEEVMNAEVEFSSALQEAVEQGRADEDHSAGHALMKDPRAREAQERFIDLAALYGDSLRLVLRESRFPLQRALAAQVLGYLPDKRMAVEALTPALTDASAAVRNDAARAVWIIADYARDKPELRVSVPVEPLVAMLHSLVWTDRNKSSLVLMALTASRDSTLLALLDARARAELEEMAAWKTQHALAPFVVLGRIDGREDQEIFAAWQARGSG